MGREEGPSLAVPVRRRRAWGQSLTEFAVVAPLMLFTLFGIFEGGLLAFGFGESRFAANEIARVVAQAGNIGTPDQLAINKARTNTPIGSNTIIAVNYIDIYLVHVDGFGNLIKDTDSCAGTPCQNRYLLNGTLVSGNWPASVRSLSAYSGDWVGVDLNFTYRWKDGIIGSIYPAVVQTATVRVRMEPWFY